MIRTFCIKEAAFLKFHFSQSECSFYHHSKCSQSLPTEHGEPIDHNTLDVFLNRFLYIYDFSIVFGFYMYVCKAFPLTCFGCFKNGECCLMRKRHVFTFASNFDALSNN